MKLKLRDTAQFEADFPDDRVEDEYGLIAPAGRNIAIEVIKILKSLDCWVSEPVDAREHGWELFIIKADRRFWGLVTMVGPVYLRLLDRGWRWPLLGARHNPVYLELISGLDEGLKGDPRFKDVRWYAFWELQNFLPGADKPISDVDWPQIPGRWYSPNPK
jgi:hypothetical protein